MNARWRSLTGEDTIESRLIQQMRNPPQGQQYRLLPGPVFPQEYPFKYSQIFNFGYFWHKYFISQRLYYCLPKRPMYVNYELLVNCFNGNLVDLSETKLHQIPHDCSQPSKELINYLTAQNLYTKEKFKERMQKLKQMRAEKRKSMEESQKINIEVQQLKQTLKPEIKSPYKDQPVVKEEEKIEEQKQTQLGWFGRIFQKIRKT